MEDCSVSPYVCNHFPEVQSTKSIHNILLDWPYPDTKEKWSEPRITDESKLKKASGGRVGGWEFV